LVIYQIIWFPWCQISSLLLSLWQYKLHTCPQLPSVFPPPYAFQFLVSPLRNKTSDIFNNEGFSWKNMPWSWFHPNYWVHLYQEVQVLLQLRWKLPWPSYLHVPLWVFQHCLQTIENQHNKKIKLSLSGNHFALYILIQKMISPQQWHLQSFYTWNPEYLWWTSNCQPRKSSSNWFVKTF